jgi:uncharacterized membrane protein
MRRFRFDPLVLASLVLALVAASGYAAAAIYRHDHFGTNAYDLGIYDQSLWLLSELHPLADNTVQRLPSAFVELPLMFVLFPLYWLWDDARMLLTAQAVLLAGASIPLFFWARAVIGGVAALLFQCAYLAFFGVIAGAIFDFHPAAVAAPLVATALYALVTQRTTLLLVACALLLLTKENYAFVVLAFGLYLAVAYRRPRIGLSIALAAVASFAFAYKIYLPWISGGAPYAAWFYDALGPDPGSAAWHVVRHPVDTVQIFFTPEDKRIGLFNLFAPWLFLPLLSPLLLLGLPTLAERFLGSKEAYWLQGFHYTLPLAPVLAFAAVDATRRLARRIDSRAAVAAGICVLLVGLYFTFWRLRPLAELERYATPSQIEAIEVCLDAIPPDALVAATSALVPHLSHRRRVYVLDDRPTPDADYYAFDRATWTFPYDQTKIEALAAGLRDRGYKTRCERESTTVLAR